MAEAKQALIDEVPMPLLTRRQTLTGIAATGGLAVMSGVIAVAYGHRPDLIRDMLERRSRQHIRSPGAAAVRHFGVPRRGSVFFNCELPCLKIGDRRISPRSSADLIGN